MKILNRLCITAITASTLWITQSQLPSAAASIAGKNAVTEDIAFEGFPYRSNFVELSDGLNMHFLDEGEGDPILLLHGVPTSSYLWRNVIPELQTQGRVIVPDLINFGKSDKTEPLDVIEHATLLNEFTTQLGLDNITYVLHDWGGPIGFIDAANNPEKVSALAFFETSALPFSNIDVLPQPFINTFIDPENTPTTIVENNLFIEGFALDPAFGATRREFTEEEKAIIREPFLAPESREQLRIFPAQLPFLDTTGHPIFDPDGPGGIPAEPVPNIEEFINYAEYLATTNTPRLFIAGNPGFGNPPSTIPLLEAGIPGLQVATVGDEENPAFHFIQEDVPEELSAVLANWISNDFTVEDRASVPEPSTTGGLSTIAVLGIGAFWKRFVQSPASPE